MAINAEFLTPLFDGVDGGEEKASKILAEHEADIVGLRRKNEELLGSVKQHGEKYEALSKEKGSLEAQIKELDEKLKANLPDKERQAFEAEIEKHKTNAANLSAEMNRQIEERDGKIKNLEAEHHQYICQTEFDNLVNADPSIIPEMRKPLRKLFFTDNQFEWVDVAGDRQLRNKESKLMKDVLADYLNTPEGQHFRVSKNTGGGALGSSGGGGNGNTITRDQLNNLSASARQDFFSKGGTLVN